VSGQVPRGNRQTEIQREKECQSLTIRFTHTGYA